MEVTVDDAARKTFPAFDPLIPDHVRDPWPILARARREQPVFWMPALNMYCVTRYADVKTILEDPVTYSNVGANKMRVPVPEGLEIPAGCPYPSVGDGLANMDAPRHTRLRKLMQPTFSRNRVQQFAPQIERIAHALIDDFIADGHADLVTQFANPMAIRTIATVLGFPEKDAAKFREWTDQFLFLMATPDMPDDEARRLWNGLLESHRHIRDAVRQRRDSPQNDLISDLIRARAEDGGPALTEDEIVANVVAFIAAGTDTTAIFITQTVRLLHRERLWEKVRDDRARLDRVLEEALRLTGVVRGINRVTTRDTVLSGMPIPAGSTIYWMGSSANRDPEHFDDPERFDPDRKVLFDHFAFSGGNHFCMGSPLARLESKIAFNALFDRVPALRVAAAEVEFHPNFVTPAPTRLPVEWAVS
jgi:cytochrome P450